MTRREFIQRCCIELVDKYGPITSVMKAKSMADELERQKYHFDQEDSIVSLNENGK